MRFWSLCLPWKQRSILPLSHVSDIDIFLSNCNAFIWVTEAFSFAELVETACKQAHFTVASHTRALNSA